MFWIIIGLMGIFLLSLFSIYKKMTWNDNGILFDKIEELWSSCNGSKEDISYRYKNLKKRDKNKIISEIKRSYDNIQKNYERIISYKIDNINNGERWIIDNINIIEKEYKVLIRCLHQNSFYDLPIFKSNENKELSSYPRVLLMTMRFVKKLNEKITKEKIIEEFKGRCEGNRLCYREFNFIKASLSFSLIQGIAELSKEIALITEEEEYAKRMFQQLKEKELDEEKFLNILDEAVCKNRFFMVNKCLLLLREDSENNVFLYNVLNSIRKITNINEEAISLKIKDFLQKNEERAQVYLKSLNFIDKIQWEGYISRMSYVEKTLMNDPAGVYGIMDLETKKLYRNSIEKIAKRAKVSEFEIIDFIMEKCRNAEDEIHKHVGFYLIDNGKKTVFDRYKVRVSRSSWNKKFKVRLYIFTNTLLTIVFILILLRGVYMIDAERNLVKYILPFIVLIPSFSQLSLTLINWGISLRKSPEIIPKIDYSKGIDKKIKTCVIIPCMFGKESDIDELIDKLEIYYLGNREKGVYFALLADFLDNANESVPLDKFIVEHAKKEIAKLNKKYNEDTRFNVFIRRRIFNDKDGYWMGWERKRGKLSEFNGLLRGDENTTFNVIGGNLNELSECKYIITLDEDTFLPIGGCGKLVGAMEHVLNKPVYNHQKRIIERGYSIIQPRISINHESHHKTFFSRIFSGDIGFDIYTRAVSDIYQDVFKEGIFTGKGIYNIDMFEDILKKEIPEYAVLSHDLIEGSFVKCGLATDIEFIDSYPSNYYSFSKRLHRWVRGDWQLIKFLKRKNLELLNKIQIMDNMRRSLVSPSILAIIIFSLMNILPNDKGVWLVAALISYITPVLINISEVIFLKAKTYGLLYESKNYKNTIERIIILIAFIPYNAYSMVDAIVRTIYRVFISKKNLLQWTPASRVERRFVNSLGFYIKEMIVAPIFVIGVMITAYFYCVDLMIYYLIPCGLWFFSPIIAYNISRECKPEVHEEISTEDSEYLRRIARKTWAFFEDNVTEDNNYLGIDNIQIKPEAERAERTSPTNIGMALTSNICAYDFGYISILDFLDRVENTIESIDKLEKFNGHLLNWYDVRTLEALEPKFVSTVDSGNLISYLYLLKRFLEKCDNDIIPNKNRMNGLRDTMELLNLQYGKKFGDNKLLFNAYENIQNIEEGIDFAKAPKVSRYLTNILNELEGMCGKEFWTDKTKKILHSINREEKYFQGEMLSSKKITATTLSKLSEMKEEDIGEGLYRNCSELKNRIEVLKNKISEMIDKADFKKLYNSEMGLFSIGYEMNNEKLSENYYDLIASEARITSFIAISKGDIPVEHWFKLGRNLFMIGDKRVFASWSGTTFEYFMPNILLQDFKGSAFYETTKGVIKAQKSFGREYDIPYGISESAYYGFDVNENYQYKAFGVPSLAVKNILNPDLVISPYSTFLMMLSDKVGSLRNIKKLREIGMEGKYGFYEAVDFTTRRMKRDKKYEVIKSFMIHHQGMTLMSLDNIINNNRLRNMFHSIPNIKSMERILNEKIPNSIIFDNKKRNSVSEFREEKKEYIRKYKGTNLISPEIHGASNDKYSTLISYTGRGESKFNNISLNYFNRDYVNEQGGILFFIDLDGEKFFSLSNIDEEKDILGEIIFKHNDATFFTNTEGIYVKYNCTLDNSEPLEYRTIEIENRGDRDREISLYNYCEIILSETDAFRSHPSFGKLFMNTFYLQEEGILVCKRRRKGISDKDTYAYTYLVSEEECKYQSDRRLIVNRGNRFEDRVECIKEAQFDNNFGDVLDPVFSSKTSINLQKGEKKKLVFCFGITDSVEEIKRIYNRNKVVQNIEDSIKSFDHRSFKNLEILDISSNNYGLIMNICSKLIYQKRNISEFLEDRKLGTQEDLWKFGISGDYPIVFLQINKSSGLIHVKQLIKAHQYLKVLGITIDIIIVCAEQKGYNQPLREAVFNEVEELNVEEFINTNGGIYIKNLYEIKEDIDIFKYVSILLFDDDEGPLFVQIPFEKKVWVKEENLQYEIYKEECMGDDSENLKFYNGYGGFDDSEKEYIIHLKDGENTPAPWCNVVSSDNMGIVISERGSVYTWYDNSREFKISPWNNDELSDIGEEYLYILDGDKGKIFSITKAPFEGKGYRRVTHGIGYSIFEFTYEDIEFKMKVYINKNDNIKHVNVTCKNNSECSRNFKVAYFSSLVLGVNEDKMRRYIKTKIDKDNNLIYAENPYNTYFKNCKVFLKIVGGSDEVFTGDRYEVLRNGSISNPLGIMEGKISEIDGIGSSCLFQQSSIIVNPGGENRFHVIIGAGESLQEIEALSRKYDLENTVYEDIRNQEYWRGLTNKIKVETPDSSFNIMMNSWLIYQVLSCRYKGRTAFYQSGGAYGFRDQLQDLSPIIYFEKDTVRDYIILASKKMFVEGDVLHWWHERIESGIRTRFCDDLLWLPYVVSLYVKTTGDYELLDINTSYIHGEPLEDEECERYGIYKEGEESDKIFDKCVKVIRRVSQFGVHGIPLVGCGDWNDGMNNIGIKGKGESVWLGEFLYHTIDKFIPICRNRGKEDIVGEFTGIQERLKESINTNAWDGDWFKRAFFDDGTPLGSKDNENCKIDMISQAWSAISGVGDKDKCIRAMESAHDRLVDYDNGLIKLLTPAFDSGKEEPGYIKGYVKGIRENGGQYTHGIVWALIAYIKLGDAQKAFELFSLINPINKTDNIEKANVYTKEPYVMCGDVYANEENNGLGGWSWYTGSAAWLYRFGLENLLGFNLIEDEKIKINPNIPKEWDGFKMKYRHEKAVYSITVKKGDMEDIIVNGEKVKEDYIELKDSGSHEVLVFIKDK